MYRASYIASSFLFITFKHAGNEKPTMSKLNQFLTKYCGHWHSVGYHLGLKDEVLNMIDDDHSTQQRESFRVALQKWLEQDVSATWSTLELAITNACREELSLESLKECKKCFLAWYLK